MLLLFSTAPESSLRRVTPDVKSELPTPKPRSSFELPTLRMFSEKRDEGSEN